MQPFGVLNRIKYVSAENGVKKNKRRNYYEEDYFNFNGCINACSSSTRNGNNRGYYSG